MDRRLLTCANMCRGRKIADIGTDHGYLPCYMIENDMCDFALACDVAQKPLESAKNHIESRGYSSKISAVLSDGLDNVERGELSDVVMAGMGGELISCLIDKCQWARDLENPVNFVLQPMTKCDFLRRWLFENNFAVVDEKACVEGRFVYSVMSARYCGEKPSYECDLKYLYFGFVKSDCEDGKEYIKRQIMRLRTAGKGMIGTKDKAEKGKIMLDLADEVEKSLGQ